MDIKSVIESSDMVFVGVGEAFNDSDGSLDAYNKLAGLLNGKNYFVISLCTDDQIFSSDLNPERIVSPLGGFRKKQCPDGCNDEIFEDGALTCPYCNKQLVFNNIYAPKYVEKDYLPQWNKHKLWLSGTLNHSLLLLELGVGMKYPQIVRWPFERLCMLNNQANLVRVNDILWQIPAEISGKSTSIKKNPIEYLDLL